MLAQCREEEPDVEIRLLEVPLAEQAKGLRSGLYDAGFAQAAEVGEGIVVKSVWSDPLVIAVPTRHPLLAHKRIPLAELIRYPLVPCHPEICEGCYRQIKRILRTVDTEPIVAEYAATMKLAYRPGDQPPAAICTLLLPCDDGTMRHIALQPLPRRLTGHRCAEKIVVRICGSRRASRKPEPTQ